jgi:hypothetical protein
LAGAVFFPRGAYPFHQAATPTSVTNDQVIIWDDGVRIYVCVCGTWLPVSSFGESLLGDEDPARAVGGSIGLLQSLLGLWHIQVSAMTEAPDQIAVESKRSLESTIDLPAPANETPPT